MSKVEPNLHHPPYTRGVKIFYSSLCLLTITGVIYFVYRYGNPADPLFWITGLVVALLALTTFLLSRLHVFLYLIIFVLIMSLPVFLADEIPALASIRTTPIFYVLALACRTLYVVNRSEKTEPQSENFPPEFVLPSYLPEDFKETSRSTYRKKSYEVAELVYTNSLTDHLIWVKESKGEIPDDKPYKNMQAVDKVIKGIPIHIEQEILKPTSRRVKNGEPAFIEASWSSKGINFNLRSDGLSLGEAERVVASIIR